MASISLVGIDHVQFLGQEISVDTAAFSINNYQQITILRVIGHKFYITNYRN